MAEVTGYLGAEQIELNNAATEATLKQLLAATLLMATKTGKGSNAHKELEKLAKAVKESTANIKKNTDADTKKANQLKKSKEVQKAYDEAQEKSTKRTVAALNGIDGLTKATVSAANKLTAMVSSVANMGNSFSGAAGVLGQIPLVGGLIGPVFSAIGAAGDKVFTSFQQAASVGASFNGNIRTMVKSASDAGLTIDQFTGLIAKNSESLAMLGNGTADGAKRLAHLSKTIRQSPLGDDLARLGYSTEQISNSMVGFAGRLAKSGALRGMKDAEIAAISGQYLKNLDAVSKLTGKSKESLEAQAAARMRDAQYLQLKNKLDADGQKNLEVLMMSIPEGMQAGAKEVLATGTATTQAGRDFLAFMGDSGRSLQELGSSARRSGTITEQQMTKTAGVLQVEGKRLSESDLGNTLGLFVPGVNDMIVAASEYAGQTTTMAEQLVKNRKILENAEKNKGQDPTDPAALQKLQQELAKTTNDFTMMLAARMPELTSAFTTLTENINGPVTTAFNLMMDNFKTIAVGVAAFSGLLIGLKTVLTGKQLLDSLLGGRGSSPLNPLFVREGIGGGINKGGGNLFKNAGKLLKGAALVGTAITAYDAYNQFQNVDKQVAEGKMTKEEATRENTITGTTAVGTVAGGIGGAKLGAMAGALGGPVGMAIGAVVGGAIGSIAASTVTEAAVKKLTEDPNSIWLKKATIKPYVNPTTVIPKSPTASTDLAMAQKDMTKTIDDKNKAMTAAATQKLDPKTAAAAKDVMSTGTTNKPLTGQETPEQLLASLNTKLDQLIKVSKNNFDIAARQLTVQQGLSGNLHYSA